MLELRSYEVLLQFARSSSIRATADALGYTPSAVSQQISVMERALGYAVLERGPRSAVLTSRGRALASRASALLDLASATERAAASAAGRVEGRVRVAAIPSLAPQVAGVVAEVMAQHPGVEVVLTQVSSEQAKSDLVSRTVDLAVIDAWGAEKPAQRTQVSMAVVAEEPLLLAWPAEAAPSTASPSELLTLPWLSTPLGNYSRSHGDEVLARLGLSPALRWEFEGLDLIAGLVADRRGVSLLPRSVIARQPPSFIHARSLSPADRRTIISARRATPAARDDILIRHCEDALKRSLSAPPKQTAGL